MPNNARDVFAWNLRELLDCTGRTQADLIRELGLRQSTVSDWMSGKKYPRVDKIQLLADYFGVNRSALTEGQPAQSLPGTTEWLRAGSPGVPQRAGAGRATACHYFGRHGSSGPGTCGERLIVK